MRKHEIDFSDITIAKMDDLFGKYLLDNKPIKFGKANTMFGSIGLANKFEVGDRVITTRNLEGKETKDLHGTVAAFVGKAIHPIYMIRYDRFMAGHNGGFMNGNFGYYWAVSEKDLVKEAGQPERNIMSELSTLAKRTFDADTKALVKVGLLNNSLTLRDADLLLDMLVTVFKKELVSEAKKRIAEQESESK